MIPTIRAWVKEQRRMILPENIISISYEYQSIIEQTIYLANDLLPTERDLSEHCFDDIILMQSTGLFDKNGVEIFEGDILECENVSNKVKWLETVSWSEEKAQFVSREVDAIIERDTELCSLFSPTFMSVRVIGNVHENSELLEVE